MIQRINLIEKEPFQFSYNKLIKVVVVMILFCGLLYGFQVMRLAMNNKKTESLTFEIVELKKERERLLKRVEPEVTGGTTLQQLKRIFDLSPSWAKTLSDITHRLPGTVWLTSFKSANPNEAKKTTGNKLLIKGKARSAADLSVFIGRLNESPYVSRAFLISSRKAGPDFTFEIDCDIMAVNN